MYVISSKGIPADVTGGDDVATRNYSLCPRCVRMSMRSLRSRRALFEEGALTSAPRGSGPTLAEAERAPEIVGITGGSDRKIGDGHVFFSVFPCQIQCSIGGFGSTFCNGFFRAEREHGARVIFLWKEEGNASVERDEAVGLPPQSVSFEELLEVVTRAVAKLNIEWPADKEC